jgi:hypothetical protein
VVATQRYSILFQTVHSFGLGGFQPYTEPISFSLINVTHNAKPWHILWNLNTTQSIPQAPSIPPPLSP